MRTKKRHPLSIALVVFLAILMAVQSPLHVLAASKKNYVKELYIVTEDQLGEYKDENGRVKEGYQIYEQPLYENIYNKKEGVKTKTYLVAETTGKAEEAVTDIKAMRMNGGFSFDEYNIYMKKLISNIESNAKSMMTAVNEFKANYEKGSEYAKIAYELLNFLLYDDDQREDVKKDGKYMKLGDLFLSDQMSEKIMTTLLLETNTDVPAAIRTALAIACSRDDHEKTFLENVQSEEWSDAVWEALNSKKLDFSMYEAFANELVLGTLELQAAVQIYNDKLPAYNEAKDKDAFIKSLAAEDFYNAKTIDEFMDKVNTSGAETRSDVCELFCKGKELTALLKDVKYIGQFVAQDEKTPDGQEEQQQSSEENDDDERRDEEKNEVGDVSLYDLLVFDRSVYAAGGEEKNLITNDLMNEMKYFAHAMTPGMRAISGLNITEILTVVLTKPSAYTEKINELKKDEEKGIREELENGISVFYGIDRDIFREGQVAMTSSAIEKSAKGDTSWATKQEAYIQSVKSRNIMKAVSKWGMVASGPLALISGVAYYKYADYVAEYFVEDKGWSGITGSEPGGIYNVNQNIAKEIDVCEAFFGKAMKKNGMFKVGISKELALNPEAFDQFQLFSNIKKRTLPDDEVVYGLYRGVDENEQPIVIRDYDNYTSDDMFFVGGTKRSAASAATGSVLGVTFFVSAAVLLASIVMYCVTNKPNPVYNDNYQQIPGILCDNRILQDGSSIYVYYYGVKNPNLKTTESYYENSENHSKELPENKRQVMDIYNWELQGHRQWLCLYTTKDLKVGRPVLADSLRINSTQDVSGTVGLNHFNTEMSNQGFDLRSPYNVSIEDLGKTLKKKTDKFKLPELYIHYNIDLDAKYGSGTTASTFTDGSNWAILGIGFAGGVAIGAVIMGVIRRKKKKSEKAVG